MPSTIVVDKVTRKYSLFLPPSWQYWIRKIAENGGGGLPLVAVFHGGGQDPDGFAQTWNFPAVWKVNDEGAERRWENQFAVIYFHGWSASDGPAIEPEEGDGARRAAPDYRAVLAAINTAIERARAEMEPATAGPMAYVQKLQDAIAELRGALPLAPHGVWNSGYMPGISMQDDVAYVTKVLEEVDTYIKDKMGRVFRPDGSRLQDGIDPARRFLFGYSEGGALAYRLVHDMPSGTWAALHAMCTSIGGKPYAGLNFPSVTYDPARGQRDSNGDRWPISLFAHAGERDRTFPPGGPDDTELITPPAAIDAQSWPEPGPAPEYNDPEYQAYNVPPGQAEEYANQCWPLSVCLDRYITHNGLNRLPVYMDPAPDVEGGQGAGQTRFGRGPAFSQDIEAEVPRRDPGDAFDEPRGGGEGEEVRLVMNPEVVEYRDPYMGHTTYNTLGEARRYITPLSIWSWFRNHPRIPRTW